MQNSIITSITSRINVIFSVSQEAFTFFFLEELVLEELWN